MMTFDMTMNSRGDFLIHYFLMNDYYFSCALHRIDGYAWTVRYFSSSGGRPVCKPYYEAFQAYRQLITEKEISRFNKESKFKKDIL